MDKREIKTIERVKEAFKGLIKEKKYSDITVQNILDKAEIGRATFYGHFKTKDDVLKAIVSDIFAHLEDPHKEEFHDFTGDHDFLHLIIHMLHHFSDDKALLNAILESEGGPIFLESLKRHIFSLIKKNLIPYYEAPSIPSGLLLNHLSTSLVEIILWWITKDGCLESPEDISYYYFALIMPALNVKKECFEN